MDPCRRVHEKIEEIYPEMLRLSLQIISLDQFTYDNSFWQIKFDWVSTDNFF